MDTYIAGEPSIACLLAAHLEKNQIPFVWLGDGAGDFEESSEHLERDFQTPINEQAFKKMVKCRISSKIEKINIEESALYFVGGQKKSFDRLIWGHSIQELRALLSDEEKNKVISVPSTKSISCRVLFKWNLAPVTLEFPIRFKDLEFSAKFTNGMLRFEIDPEISSDSELLSKIIRNGKKELAKQLQVEISTLQQKKITVDKPYLNAEPIPVQSLEVAPHIFYLGPELAPNDSPLKHWALIQANLVPITQGLTHAS